MLMWRPRDEKRRLDVMVRSLGDLARNHVPNEQLSASGGIEVTDTMLAEIASISCAAVMTAQRDSTVFGTLSLRGWVYLTINHHLMRLAQIERLHTSPTVPAIARMQPILLFSARGASPTLWSVERRPAQRRRQRNQRGVSRDDTA
jgi:hypothetical protein